MQSPPAPPAPDHLGNLPGPVRAQFNGRLAGQSIVSWSRFDVDAAGRYAEQFVVLTEQNVMVLDGAAAPAEPPRAIPIASIEEAKV
ncbi:MAG: hypothetical protein ACREIT_12035, partial [Tepidisphaeraceae bacterium]